MVWDIVNLALALIAGLLTGFYFERRQTKAARAGHEVTIRQNEELTNQLDELRRGMAVVSTGVRSRITGPNLTEASQDRNGLRADLMDMARGMQDATGKVALPLLERNLSGRYTNKQIMDVTTELEAESAVELRDGFLYVLF